LTSTDAAAGLRQRGRQLDDPPLEGTTEQVKLDFGTGRDALVLGKDADATRRDVTLDLLLQRSLLPRYVPIIGVYSLEGRRPSRPRDRN
jgi:hypothetical protein